MKRTLLCGLALFFVALVHPAVGLAAEAVYTDVARIFQTSCVMCHTAPHAPLGLQLDSLERVLKGSQNGVVVNAGSPEDSELVRRIKGISQPRMPMTGPPFLDERQIAMIEGWVAAGMPARSAAATADEQAAVAPSGPQASFNYADVAPVLASRCTKCHTENGLMGPAPEGYLLTTYEATLSLADRVRVVPGYPAASELVRRIKGQSLPRMPFDGPPFLEAGEVDLIADWITQGALNPDNTPAPYPVGARIRLQGTLVGLWQLDDGLPLHVDATTRLDKSPQVGNYVEVRGQLVERGEIATERIRRR